MTTLANDVQVQLADDVLAGDTSILVEAAVAPLNNPPEPDTDSVLTLVDRLVGPQQIEIVRYTTVTDNQDGTLTIGGLTRGQEGTSAQAFNAGGYVFQAATAGVLSALAQFTPDARYSITVQDGFLQLAADQADPGNGKVYGTDSQGNRAWKDDAQNSIIDGGQF